MPYHNCMTISEMKWLDLFDDIPYKICKSIVSGCEESDWNNDWEVKITDLPIPDHERYNKRKTMFEFDLTYKEESGVRPRRHFKVIKYYDTCSQMAEFIDENLSYDTDSDSDSDSYSDSDSEQ